MADGHLKAIHLVKPGDHVLSFDEATSTLVHRRVKKCLRHAPEAVVALKIEGVERELRVTPRHRFLADGRWSAVGDIPLRTLLSGHDESTREYRPRRLLARRRHDRAEPVFNLELERGTTYFVEAMIVHQEKTVDEEFRPVLDELPHREHKTHKRR
jgi:hypothetical protein